MTPLESHIYKHCTFLETFDPGWGRTFRYEISIHKTYSAPLIKRDIYYPSYISPFLIYTLGISLAYGKYMTPLESHIYKHCPFLETYDPGWGRTFRYEISIHKTYSAPLIKRDIYYPSYISPFVIYTLGISLAYGKYMAPLESHIYKHCTFLETYDPGWGRTFRYEISIHKTYSAPLIKRDIYYPSYISPFVIYTLGISLAYGKYMTPLESHIYKHCTFLETFDPGWGRTFRYEISIHKTYSAPLIKRDIYYPSYISPFVIYTLGISLAYGKFMTPLESHIYKHCTFLETFDPGWGRTFRYEISIHKTYSAPLIKRDIEE